MTHLGNVMDVKGNEVEPVDVITFGSPCQDMSIAGKRAGLKHESKGDEETTRSGLFMEAVRIIKEMRGATNNEYPRFAVWENVPGAFSSNKGEDFRIVLEELIKIVEPSAAMPPIPKSGWPYADSYSGDGWSLAYRVFDAQYWGVPQRRRRIYLVIDFRGQYATKILFEREGLRGYSAESCLSWQRATTDVENSTGTANSIEKESITVRSASESNIAPCLYAAYGTKWNGNSGAYNGENFVLETKTKLNDQHLFQPIAFTQNQRNEVRNLNGVAGALAAEPGMKQQTFIAQPMPASSKQQTEVSTVIDGNILDDQGGQQINVREDGKSPTLRAEMHGNVPCIMNAIGFDGYNGDLTGDVTSTLGVNCGMSTGRNGIVLNDQGGNRMDITYTESLDCRNMVANPELSGTLQAKSNGGFSLNYINPVVYGICSKNSNSMKSNNPNSGFYEAKTTRTLDANGGNPTCNQGGMVVIEGNGSRPSHQGDGYKESDVMYTLNTVDRHAVYTMTTGSFAQVAEDKAPTVLARDYKDPTAVCYGIGRDTFNQGKNAKFAPTFEPELQPTLVAKGPGAIQSGYIVRRMTPTECARLQGFPDTWGIPDVKEELTNEEYEFWLKVRNDHAKMNGRAVKDYTKDQILNWYNKLHTDSSEYKLWGNGIALPNALYVMEGIADVFKEERD